MVHTKSEKTTTEYIREAFGSIIAVTQDEGIKIYVHDDDSTTTDNGSCIVHRLHSLEHLIASNEWVYCQVCLSKKMIPAKFDSHFYLDRNEHGYPVYRAVNTECHSKFDVYLTGNDTFEVDLEII